MEKVIQVLNQMQADGVFDKYAIGGGIAAIYYLEPYQTDDIDVFISPVLVGESGLISFGSMYAYLEDLGYYPEGESILIEDWLVQFLPGSEPVQEEAVINAKQVRFGDALAMIFSAEYLAAEWLRSGREKDWNRVLALLRSESLDEKVFMEIIARHGFIERFNVFAARYDWRSQ